jgi:hypothetical protein
MTGAEEIEKGLRRRARTCDEFIAFVAELLKKLAGSFLKREGLEIGEC